MRWLVGSLVALAVCGGLVLLPGCAAGSPGARSSIPASESPAGSSGTQVGEDGALGHEPRAPGPGLDTAVCGRIRFVHAGLRYAVMDFPLWRLPAFEQRLRVYRDGQEVGEIRITGPVMESTVAGDILEGDLKVGDEVLGE